MSHELADADADGDVPRKASPHSSTEHRPNDKLDLPCDADPDLTVRRPPSAAHFRTATR